MGLNYLFLELKQVFPSWNDVHAQLSGVYPSSSMVLPSFTCYGKHPRLDKLTIEQAVQFLKAELGQPNSEKKSTNLDETRV